DALGRAVRRDQLGELALQVLELPNQPVVVVVRDLGVVEHVVAVGVVVDLLVQLLHALARVGEPPLLRPAPPGLLSGRSTPRAHVLKERAPRPPYAASSRLPARPTRSPRTTIAPWTPVRFRRYVSAARIDFGLVRIASAPAAAASARMLEAATITTPSPVSVGRNWRPVVV